jgi:predicted transcriptional regulator
MHLSLEKKPEVDNLKKPGDLMRQKTVSYFTDKEEEFTRLLIALGTKKNIATVLVFMVNVPEATSHEIERGTDLRQPEISMAMKYMEAEGWVRSRENPSENKGRPTKMYTLAVPVSEIMDRIGAEKKEEMDNRLALVKKLREYF